MIIRVLGPIEVIAEGQMVVLGGAKPRALLAILALNAGATVPAERLIVGLWGEAPPATAVKLVQLYVSQLRKAFAAAGADGAIITREPGYLLDAAVDVDARRFERLVGEGDARAALALWRGPPLSDVADQPFAAAEIRRLEELRLQAAEQAVDADLAAGRHVEVVAELTALLADEPLREGLHGRLMLALYRSGRQADALATYRDARAALVEQVGIEPGPALRGLHEAILRQDPTLDLPSEAPEAADPAPAGAPPLAGRDRELAVLSEYWRRARDGAGGALVVTGPRGSGRSRLVAALADACTAEGAEVVRTTGAEAARAALDRLGHRDGPTLLVLDDAEGVALPADLDGTPALVVATATGANSDGAFATLELGPLGPDAIAAIAADYAAAGAEIPVARLEEESGGVPARVHEAAAAWARTEAAERLAGAAARAGAERARLRAAEDDVAASITAIQAAGARNERDGGAPGVVVCPFKGLASFDVDDAEYFFGRERLVAEMVARAAGAPLMGLVGPSGSGKSSALRAGLLAALGAGVLPGSERWAIALMRPGAHPLEELDRATAVARPDGRLVLAVDQFEELFTAGADPDEQAAFVDALVAAARDPRRRALVLIAVRADFYGHCAAFPELSRMLGASHVLVGPMRRDELRRAIERPARRAGLEVEPALVDALTADVEGEPGALPLLSSALLELWTARDGRRLTLAAYEHAGGVHGAVARLAERAYGALSPERADIARRVLLRLTGEGEGDAVVRRRVALADLEDDGDPRVAEVVGALADARLVSIGAGHAEVAHEALLREWPRLRGWLEEDAHGRHLHAQLRAAARGWDAGGRDDADLYRGARLAAALDWAGGHRPELGAAERAFLDAGRAASQRSHRRLRAGLAAVAALLAVAVLAGVLALDQRGRARSEATTADAQRVGALALAENDLDRALLLARQGVALDDETQTRGNLLAAAVRSPAAIGILRGAGERMWETELAPDERTVAVGDPTGNVFLFDTRTRRLVRTIRPGNANSWITELAFSPDGRRLAIGHDTAQGNTVAIADPASGRIVRRLETPEGGFVYGLGYTRGGRTIDVIISREEPTIGPSLLTRFDAASGRRVLGPRAINARAGSPLMVMKNGRRLVVGGQGETVVRDLASLRVLRRIPVGADAHASPDTKAYALSPDDRTFAVGDPDGRVRLLDLDTGAVRRMDGRHEDRVNDLTFTPDGRTLVSASEDGTLILWDVRRAAVAETLTGHSAPVRSPHVTRDGSTLYTAGLDGTAFMWDLTGARRIGRPFRIGTGNEGRAQASVSSDGRLLAMGQGDGAVGLVELRGLARRAPIPVFSTSPVHAVLFVPGTGLLVAGADNGELVLLDTGSGRVLRRLRGHHGVVWTPAITADGRLLVTGSDDGTVRFWSLPEGRALGPPLRFRDYIFDAQVTPDGRLAVVTLISDDFLHGAIELWDVRTRRRVRTIPTSGFMGDTRVSADGTRFASGSRFGQAQVWSTDTGRPVTRRLSADASGVFVTLSPDARTLVTTSDTGNVRLWDVAGEKPVGAPLPGPRRVAAAVFTPDGRSLLVVYDTGRAYRWDLRADSIARHACRVAGRRLTRAEWSEFLPGRDYAPAC